MKKFTRRTLTVATLAAVALSTSGYRFSGFPDTAGKTAANNATTWLKAQQQSDGSFELAGFPGFETPDAIMAIAENAQLQTAWKPSQALAAVMATTNNGYNPLHAIDDLVDGGISAGQAAKIIVLVAKPLGLSAINFDPDGDGGTKNLKTLVTSGKQPDGSYGTFNATLYAMIALRKTSVVVGPDTVAYMRAAQESGGGWNYAGDNSGAYADVDTTALAIQAMIASRVPPTDADVRQGLAFLAAQYQSGSGAWQSFGSDDPNSTAAAMLAITAAGFNPEASCWRNSVAPALTGQPYPSPSGWLRSQQQPDGHIASPNDIFGLNTFASSQSIQALRRGWLPIAPAAKQPCS